MAVVSKSIVREAPQRRGKLVKVEMSPGRFVKMHEEDAREAGHIAKPKARQAPANKMMTPPPTANKLTESTQTADDFTTIPGIGKSAAKAITANGITTFAALRMADLMFLNQRARAAVEAWRAE